MEPTKTLVDYLSGFFVFISFLPSLPIFLSSLAALLSAVWYCIRIYEYIKEKRTPKVNND